MADFDGVVNKSAAWDDVPQLSTTALALGGVGGPMNAQALALVARDKQLLRLHWEKAAAEAGYNLVAGSFEAGAVITTSLDVVLYETQQKIYSYGGTIPVGGMTIAAGSTPTPLGSGGWIDRSDVTLRGDLQGSGSTIADIAASSLFVSVTNVDYAGGVKGDGVTDDTDAFIAAVTDANTKNKKLVCPAGLSVRLTGSTNIDVNTDVDFNGSTIDLRDYTGRITFLRRETVSTYNSASSVVTALQAEASLTGKYWSGWNGVTEVEDSFVIINSSQNFYSYRNVVQTRVEFNKVSRYGMVESPLKYPLDPTTITSIDVYKMPSKWTTVENIVFNISELGGNPWELIRIETSLFEAKKWRFIQGDEIYTLSNPTIVNVIRSCHVRLDGVYYQWANRATNGSGYTYNLGLESSYDVSVADASGDGDGWGATGSNSCQRVHFENCQLSRIDFHQPFRELLQLDNCRIGSWGILVTALGDLVINGGTVAIDDQAYINNAGVVRSREDTGGFCDGRLIIDGLRVVDNSAATSVQIVKHSWSSGNAKPAGSPINYQFWNSVTYDKVASNKHAVLMPNPVGYTDISFTSSVTVNDCLDGSFELSTANFAGQTPSVALATTTESNPATNTPNLIISVKNSRIKAMSLVEAIGSKKFCIKADFYGIQPVASLGVNAELFFRGVVSFDASLIESLDFYSGGALDKPLRVNVNGGEFRHTAAYAASPVGLLGSKVILTFSGVHLSAPDITALYNYLTARVVNCTYSYSDATYANEVAIISDFAGNLTQAIPTGLNRWNTYTLLTGYDSDNTSARRQFLLPYPGKSVYIPVSATVGITLSVNAADTQITTTNAGSSALAARFIYA